MAETVQGTTAQRESDDEVSALVAAFIADVHLSTIHGNVRSGRLPARWSFGKLAIRRDDLRAWAEARENRRPGHHDAERPAPGASAS